MDAIETKREPKTYGIKPEDEPEGEFERGCESSDEHDAELQLGWDLSEAMQHQELRKVAGDLVNAKEWAAEIDRINGTPKPQDQRFKAPGPTPKRSSGETKEQRQARRYQACIDAGLRMPTDDYSHLPRGLKDVAEAEGITRQAFSEDVKAHIRRLNSM